MAPVLLTIHSCHYEQRECTRGIPHHGDSASAFIPTCQGQGTNRKGLRLLSAGVGLVRRGRRTARASAQLLPPQAAAKDSRYYRERGSILAWQRTTGHRNGHRFPPSSQPSRGQLRDAVWRQVL